MTSLVCIFSFWKTNKSDWRAKKKQTDAITNQNERQAALANKDDDHKDNYKKIFEKLVKKNKWNKSKWFTILS